jgi:putative FmdB family regulatory protein
MPIYEYRCKKCGKSVEAIQKVDDSPLTTCEACSGPLEKLVSRSSFQLRGGGWFRSGYSSGSGSGSSDSESSAKKTGDDSKPAKSDDVKAASGGGCAPGGCGCH